MIPPCVISINYSIRIFEKSKEMPVIMLGLNAISTLSSHISQINGLRKSKRENKDYLITYYSPPRKLKLF